MNGFIENLYQEELYRIPRPRAVVIIPTPWEDLRPEDVALLSKILASIKLSLAAVRINVILNVDFNELQPDETGDTLLIFGSKTKPSLDVYKKEKVKDFHVIVADRLNELDDVKKKNLWLALKAL